MDYMKLKGAFVIVNTNTGQIVEVPNTTMNVGFSTISALAGSGITIPDRFSHTALGLGSSTVTAADTTLGSEAYRVATTQSQITTTVTDDTLQMVGSFAIDATKTINEAGVFNHATLDTGSMLARTCFADVNCTSGDSINTTWTVKFS